MACGSNFKKTPQWPKIVTDKDHLGKISKKAAQPVVLDHKWVRKLDISSYNLRIFVEFVVFTKILDGIASTQKDEKYMRMGHCDEII